MNYIFLGQQQSFLQIYVTFKKLHSHHKHVIYYSDSSNQFVSLFTIYYVEYTHNNNYLNTLITSTTTTTTTTLLPRVSHRLATISRISYFSLIFAIPRAAPVLPHITEVYIHRSRGLLHVPRKNKIARLYRIIGI